METSIIFILEFWSQFGEEKPDLQKIFDIADKLFPTKVYNLLLFIIIREKKSNFFFIYPLIKKKLYIYIYIYR